MGQEQQAALRKSLKPLLVTAAVIRHGGKVLIARRLLSSSVEPGKWEFPGGKVEHGEHPQDCLKREILEELNLEIEVDSFLDVSSHVYERSAQDPLHVVLLCYLCHYKSGELRKLQVEDALWVEKNEISHYDFAAADLPLIRTYLEKQV